MPKGYIVIFVSILVLGGHLGLLPMIFFFASRFEMADKLDTAFVIGPITAAYFITISKFVIDTRSMPIVTKEKVNALYAIFSIVISTFFVFSIYTVIWMMQNLMIVEISTVKRSIGVIELFVGGGFALFVDNIFGAKR
ncbi:hypothetical protein [uncultured Cohaesibacter sp.]|uniref:hypothetical protein n=1 Tax=uncultured Cohaesibacter sp. TaxID=1002546 RepID=UPI0029C75B58|nr:hypothetical protein [uncultured Cohaesibacter sp.]